MLKRRLIPVLFLREGWIVRSELFTNHQIIGDPVGHVERMVDWNVDELIVIDISSGSAGFQHQRHDLKNKPVERLDDFIKLIATKCRIPLTFGGGIKSLDDVAKIINCGADKVSINTLFFGDSRIISKAATRFGSQALVLSVDYRCIDGEYFVYKHKGSKNSKRLLQDVLRIAEDLGVGEVLMNSIDRDGKAQGYDIKATELATSSCSLPIITCGGAGHNIHFFECFSKTNASAIAAGNIFHFSENAYPRSKEYLRRKGVPLR